MTGVRSSCDASATNWRSRASDGRPLGERVLDRGQHRVERVAELARLGALAAPPVPAARGRRRRSRPRSSVMRLIGRTPRRSTQNATRPRMPMTMAIAATSTQPQPAHRRVDVVQRQPDRRSTAAGCPQPRARGSGPSRRGARPVNGSRGAAPRPRPRPTVTRRRAGVVGGHVRLRSTRTGRRRLRHVRRTWAPTRRAGRPAAAKAPVCRPDGDADASCSSTRSTRLASVVRAMMTADRDEHERHDRHAGEQPGAQRHPTRSRSVYPTPRTVWMRRGSTLSTFLRR